MSVDFDANWSKFYRMGRGTRLAVLWSLLLLTFTDTLGHFTFWISLSLRPKTETKLLSFGLSPRVQIIQSLQRTSLLSP